MNTWHGDERTHGKVTCTHGRVMKEHMALRVAMRNEYEAIAKSVGGSRIDDAICFEDNCGGTQLQFIIESM